VELNILSLSYQAVESKVSCYIRFVCTGSHFTEYQCSIARSDCSDFKRKRVVSPSISFAAASRLDTGRWCRYAVWRLFEHWLTLNSSVDQRILIRAQINWMEGLWNTRLDDNASTLFCSFIRLFTSSLRYAVLQSSFVQLCSDRSFRYGRKLSV